MRYYLRNGVLRICSGNWQKIFSINKYSTLLHDSEWPFGASLLHVPKEIVFDALKLKLKLTFLIASSAALRSSALSLPSPSLSKSFDIT